ncbi:MAG TPA: helix-turn-helix domain-containing protein [Ideonella sp.]|uniref:helix-turn-helix domain-containing protein n=1 Tax=Ideonella sp. TaxID=1929293 RepID=UPI002CD9E48E|nr:helix-turn-helix domain-containing protein [Ideonella sp.]HSI51700.1 helix-turn-helix domain-containing protein [Ideonella sp.]
MDTTLLLSTDDLPPSERTPAWQGWMHQLFGGLQSDVYGASSFEGHVHVARAGEVVLTRLEAQRHRVLRSPQLARASDSACLKIVAPWLGTAVVEQMGRQAWVRPGAWAIYDTTGSYEITNPEQALHLIVMLPKQRLQERGLHLSPLMGRQVGGSHGISRVALEAMRNTFQELPTMSAEAACGAGEMLLELVRLSLQELAGQHTATSQQQALKDRIRAHVEQHLRDPALSIEQIAQALNCSKRHLHNAFADEADTLAHHILRRRLQACMRELRQPALDQRTITEIAFSWGFSNGAYFSRVFRDHTGLSPSDYRHASR